ncbi:MAG: hypothetical protein QME66_11670 [Candidatus Eisenbacteria bacterium]|nr:hypothetical protein [Candidatus Eisenbacteria bacterium]
MKARILAILLLIFLSGCWNPFSPDVSKPPGPQQAIYLPPTSPENVVKNLLTAYNYRDFVNYEPLLDSLFVFYFSQEDASGLAKYGISQLRWGIQEELESTQNLFNANWSGKNAAGEEQPAASSINLTITEKQSEEWQVYDPDTAIKYAKIDGMRVNLRVVAGPTEYITGDAYVNFKFRGRLDPASNKVLSWKIYEWRDLGNNPAGPSAASQKGTGQGPIFAGKNPGFGISHLKLLYY